MFGRSGSAAAIASPMAFLLSPRRPWPGSVGTAQRLAGSFCARANSSNVDSREAESAKPFRHRQKVDSNFTDVMVIKLSSGAGGNGNVSFARDQHRPKGPPCGGDGGAGGSIYVQAVEGERSLHKLRKRVVAENGRAGQSWDMHGRRGKDVVIRVPAGTLITQVPDTELVRENVEDGEGWIHSSGFQELSESRDFFLDLKAKKREDDAVQSEREQMEDSFPESGLDLAEPGAPVLLLKGGRGGQGNRQFHTSMVRNPRFATVGRAGLTGVFRFELKTLADLGLVGLPNAGKSTLLRAISNATPRVGHWAFTTLSPYVGTIKLAGRIDAESFTVADIPGIIEGASEDRGMGVGFLRHIERAPGLVFVVGLDSADPAADLGVLLAEMGPRMAGKRVLVVGNKADLLSQGVEDKFRALAAAAAARGWPALAVSAKYAQQDVQVLLHEMARTAGVI
ncbi:GTP1/OBG domain-containing protein [Dipodascopsis tothii]|uniref:GTP1/OBG domain-containing protein n=1 Tax=Dipodascopsis tothii TaxID=44089 RepID=UPI0034CEBB3C